jgi:Helix-turn-helix domain
MSHDATNWAIRQRGLKPATKLVLWYLCDRHNPDFGCFPRQDRLAAEAEMSVSSLNDHLRLLEEAGLIRRIKRSDPKTKQQMATLYILGFEARFIQEPSPKSGDGQADLPLPKSGDGEGAESEPQPYDFPSENPADPVPNSGDGEAQKPTPKMTEKPTPKFGDYRETVREITSKEEDAGASARPFRMSDAGLDALIRIAGHDPDGELPTWWTGQIATDHVARWAKTYGFDESRILAIAKEARRGHDHPVQGPKGFDAAMKKASKAGGSEGNLDRAAFYAEWINSDRWFPDSGVSTSIRNEMLGRGLVTEARLKERRIT